MATRRRRSTTPKLEQPVVETTHEEMLEIAEEREEVAEFLDVVAADTFAAIEEAEEKIEEAPVVHKPVLAPAPTVYVPPAPPAPKPQRYILRTNDRFRKS